MNLSGEQQLSFEKYIQSKNIFITGPGGTGKTELIKHIYNDACEKGINIQICALTGCAAVLLECKAKTIHSWAGIGLGNSSIPHLINKVTKNKYAKKNWKNTNVLIIDEVSMMSRKLFETLDAIGKSIRKNSKPFGGIQLLFSGDFYQLPPVGTRDEIETSEFCFQSTEWNKTFLLEDHVLLVKIFRQSDPKYQNILNQIREGRIKKSTNDILLQMVGRSIPEDILVKPTKLLPTRSKVDNINISEINKLKCNEYKLALKYHTNLVMTPIGRVQRNEFTNEQIQLELKYLQGNLRCDETLNLKIGSQVMCIINIKSETDELLLCNGAQGTVIKMQGETPIVKYNNGLEMAMEPHTWQSETIPGIGVSQVPLILAWALTIHKSQGSTLDVAEIDAGSSIFECGQTYVALSRVKSIEGLYLTSFDISKIKINAKVREFYDNLQKLLI